MTAMGSFGDLARRQSPGAHHTAVPGVAPSCCCACSLNSSNLTRCMRSPLGRGPSPMGMPGYSSGPDLKDSVLRVGYGNAVPTGCSLYGPNVAMFPSTSPSDVLGAHSGRVTTVSLQSRSTGLTSNPLAEMIASSIQNGR